jgi:hypothetical protein
VLPKNALLLKAALFENTSRCRIVQEDVGRNLIQPEVLECVFTNTQNNAGHDPTTPQRLCQPVANLGSVELADLEVIKAAAANQGLIASANSPLNLAPVLLSGLGGQSEPFLGIKIGVRKGNRLFEEIA